MHTKFGRCGPNPDQIWPSLLSSSPVRPRFCQLRFSAISRAGPAPRHREAEALAAEGGTLPRSKSLTETSRRLAQKRIDEDNAALVRRILNTKGTFDRAADEKDASLNSGNGYIWPALGRCYTTCRSHRSERFISIR